MKPGTFVRIAHGNHRHHGEEAAVVGEAARRKRSRTWTAVILMLENGELVEAHIGHVQAVPA